MLCDASSKLVSVPKRPPWTKFYYGHDVHVGAAILHIDFRNNNITICETTHPHTHKDPLSPPPSPHDIFVRVLTEVDSEIEYVR